MILFILLLIAYAAALFGPYWIAGVVAYMALMIYLITHHRPNNNTNTPKDQR